MYPDARGVRDEHDRRPKKGAPAVLGYALVLLLGSAASAHAGAFEFAAIGDVPYSEADSLRFPRLRDLINAEDLAFVLHVGDIKGGSTSCGDEALESRLQLFSTFRHPFVLTPGDNDWTDCHRPGSGFREPLERLAKLRALFFTPPGRVLGGGSLQVVSQAADPAWGEFPENVRWSRGGVVLATLHLVGSSNALAPFPGRTPDDDAEVTRRTEAAIAWMGQAFEVAGESDAAGVVIAIHANPRFDRHQGADPPEPYTGFIDALSAETSAFARPVLLVHGDAHYFRIDKPLLGPVSGRRLDNFTRLEVFGSPHLHWVRVRVDAADPQVFRFRQELLPEHLQLD